MIHCIPVISPYTGDPLICRLCTLTCTLESVECGEPLVQLTVLLAALHVCDAYLGSAAAINPDTRRFVDLVGVEPTCFVSLQNFV